LPAFRTLLTKVACQHAAGVSPQVYVFGTDYPTPDGTRIRGFSGAAKELGVRADQVSGSSIPID